MPIYCAISNTNRSVTEVNGAVGNVNRSISTAYGAVNNTNREIFSSKLDSSNISKVVYYPYYYYYYTINSNGSNYIDYIDIRGQSTYAYSPYGTYTSSSGSGITISNSNLYYGACISCYFYIYTTSGAYIPITSSQVKSFSVTVKWTNNYPYSDAAGWRYWSNIFGVQQNKPTSGTGSWTATSSYTSSSSSWDFNVGIGKYQGSGTITAIGKPTSATVNGYTYTPTVTYYI